MTAMGQSWSWQGKPSSGNHRMEKPQWYKNFPEIHRRISISIFKTSVSNKSSYNYASYSKNEKKRTK